MNNSVYCGDALEELKKLPSNSVDMCFTSPTPPFEKIENANNRMIGSEKDTEEYVDRLVAIFSEVKRVLKETGSLFVQMGDYRL